MDERDAQPVPRRRLNSKVVLTLAGVAAALAVAVAAWFFWPSRNVPPERSVEDIFFTLPNATMN